MVIVTKITAIHAKIKIITLPFSEKIFTKLQHRPQFACNAIVSNLYEDTDVNRSIVKAVYSGAGVYYNYTGNTTCLNLDSGDDIGADMWDYQVKTDLIVGSF
jgi:hypothetical protein